MRNSSLSPKKERDVYIVRSQWPSITNLLDAAAELGRNPVSKHQIQPEYGDEQTDAGRDCRTRLARPNSQARTGTGKYSFSSSADREQDWQPYPVDPFSCYYVMIIHSCKTFVLLL